ncbi:MAG: T9SS type A sorting domain-containing protein [Bacteroidetes bacterium]|nr:T9SS type A sorting domain-containing protein [Bacteroidota bacterium]
MVPSNALLGITGLRIRSHSLPGNNFSWAACTFSTFGELEDYFVTIDLFNKVKEIETKEIKIIAYPNPASQQLTIKIDGTIKGNVRLKMLNINGKEVYTKEILNLKNTDRILLNLSSYTEGIYILQLVYNEGVVMQKVIIE